MASVRFIFRMLEVGRGRPWFLLATYDVSDNWAFSFKSVGNRLWQLPIQVCYRTSCTQGPFHQHQGRDRSRPGQILCSRYGCTRSCCRHAMLLNAGAPGRSCKPGRPHPPPRGRHGGCTSSPSSRSMQACTLRFCTASEQLL